MQKNLGIFRRLNCEKINVMKSLIIILVLFVSQSALSDHLSKNEVEDYKLNAENLFSCSSYYSTMLQLAKNGKIVGSTPGDEIIFIKKLDGMFQIGMDFLKIIHIDSSNEEWQHIIDNQMDKVGSFFIEKGAKELHFKYHRLCEDLWDIIDDVI